MKDYKDLTEYVEALSERGLLIDSKIPVCCEVSGISFDSRKIEEGTLFICKGVHFEPKFLEDAIRNGAVAYVSENIIDISRNDIPYILVNDIREAMPVLAKTYYGDISRELSIVGITGTKGKSTTSFFLRQIFDDYLEATLGIKSAICSSIENYDGVISEEARLTTPEIVELYEHMNNALESNIPLMTIEVSSQALKYGRVKDVYFNVACFLNIGQDHISPSEHPDFEDYFASKLKIFRNSKIACINMDSTNYSIIEEAAKKSEKTITFSTENSNANIYGDNIHTNDARVEFDIHIQKMDGVEDKYDHIKLNTFGVFNVSNALAACAIALALNVPFQFVKSGLAKAFIPGRMELFDRSDGGKVIVDKAHNKLSFEQLFENLNENFPGMKKIVVFGTAGGKAYNRRSEAGMIVGQNADHAIITERLPGEEDVNKICAEIARYVEEQKHATYEVVIDREAAIKRAFELADKDTIIVCAGKGRETLEKKGTMTVVTPSDVDVVNKLLMDYNA